MTTRIGVVVLIIIPGLGLGSAIPVFVGVGVGIPLSIPLPGPGTSPVVPTGIGVGSGGRLKARNAAALEGEVVKASVLKAIVCVAVAILIPGPRAGPVVRGGVSVGTGRRVESWITWLWF